MTRWYGLDTRWSVPFESDARREHGRDLCVEVRPRAVIYRHRGLEVPGRLVAVPVSVRFHAQPPYPTFGLQPEEFPRVYADRGADSPHRHRHQGDDALCLYYPETDPAGRWTPDDGLLALLNLTRDHLFFELHWRATGGHRGGVWLGPEAPHGLEQSVA